jgi:heme-degrading monooxygenase HmoA
MAIEVLIKRATDHRNTAKILLPHIINLRSHAIKQPGYISGETLLNIERAQECLVVSRWTKLEHWQAWSRSSLRIELNEKIEKLLATRAEYNIYSVSFW